MDQLVWRGQRTENKNEISGSHDVKMPFCSKTSCIRLLASHRGFTLIELLVVVAVIGVLATVALPIFSSYVTRAKSSRAAADIRTIDQAISAYFIDHNALPATLSDVGITNLLDPWGRPYEYQILGNGAAPLEDSVGGDLNTDYDLYSKGADGASAVSSADPTSTDDIVRANSGMYAGLRSQL